MSTHGLLKMRRLGFVALASIPFLTFATPASAICSGASATADLGSVSSLDAATASQGVVTATGFSCAHNGGLALVTTNTVTVTIESATNNLFAQPRLYDPLTNDFIPYSICETSTCANVYGIGFSKSWSSTTLLGILGLFSGPGGTFPLYIKANAGAQVAAGTYKSTINLLWSWSICITGILGCIDRNTGTANSSINVTMNVTKDCAIAAPFLNFGSAPLVARFDAANQSILIRCSKGAAYTVGIDNGLYPLDNVRRLKSGNEYLSYDIFYPAGSNNRWGKSAPQRRSSAQATNNAGAHTGNTDQIYTYSAVISPSQSTPNPGTYTDSLIVDVQF